MKRPILEEKDYLRAEEAVRLYGLSRRKLNRLLREGPHDFVAMYGKRILILREEFEKYLSKPGVKEELHGKTRFKAQDTEDGRVHQSER